MEPISIEELFELPRKQFIQRNLEWIKEFNGGKLMECQPLECPLHLWVVKNKMKCSQNRVPNTVICPLCEHPVCPDCMNHKVEPLSRVTGYMSNVSSWNAAKRQEFKDRNRYDLNK